MATGDRVDARPEFPSSSASRVGAVPTPGKMSYAIEQYNFKNARRGKALIINNRNFDYRLTNQNDRDGTNVDAEGLESMFVGLGFETERCDNLTTLDMSIKLREVSSEDHSDADCFACAILSHGEEGVVYGTNGKVKLENLVKNFKGDVCPSLAGKPKLFFIQACRGKRYDWGVEMSDMDDVDADPSHDGPMIRKIPVEADFLMAYSVCPGYFSWRNNVDGSWFVQALLQVVRECGTTLDILDILTMVNRKVALDFQSCTDDEFTSNMKQMPCILSTLTKKVVFASKF